MTVSVGVGAVTALVVLLTILALTEANANSSYGVLDLRSRQFAELQPGQ
ncbi:hypothetical protein OCOJLMKI_3491 [Methylobacterium iners]|uniref:Uncharacterized protein n=1 Tax=Methylobacterium iners TaxID=418707 RepID=A0ABQ4S092_9HYPH|nr:hypothetical protein OCOJLMKI_3491 [Methylobacterium iners]